MKKIRRVLILFAHPALRRSRCNRHLADAVRGLDGVTVHDLYEAYPEHDIDVDHEQRLLLEHDVVVFQHPFYWYSTPSILKEWQDLVLEHGWAYGHSGTALHGKTLISAITTGGSEGSYGPQGANGCTMWQLLAPIRQTASLCGMLYPPPIVVHGTHGLSEQEIKRHAAEYRRLVESLRDGTIDLEACEGLPRLNMDLGTATGG